MHTLPQAHDSIMGHHIGSSSICPTLCPINTWVGSGRCMQTLRSFPLNASWRTISSGRSIHFKCRPTHSSNGVLGVKHFRWKSLQRLGFLDMLVPWRASFYEGSILMLQELNTIVDWLGNNENKRGERRISHMHHARCRRSGTAAPGADIHLALPCPNQRALQDFLSNFHHLPSPLHPSGKLHLQLGS